MTTQEERQPATEAGRALLNDRIFGTFEQPLSRTEQKYRNELARQILTIEAQATNEPSNDAHRISDWACEEAVKPWRDALAHYDHMLHSNAVWDKSCAYCLKARSLLNPNKPEGGV